MLKLDKAVSNEFLRDLVRSTIRGIEGKDCFYNQLHYVNRNFIDENSDYILDILIKGLSDIYPGITRNDIAYVNDFVAPVNLQNSAVRPVTVFNKENKYQWHIDTIDQWLGPCYNLWIPLFRQKAIEKLDDRSLFDVMTKNDVPSLYDKNGAPKTNYLIDSASQAPEYLKIAHQFTGIDIDTVSNSFLYYDAKGKIGVLPKNQIKAHSVIKPDLRDVYIFGADQFHSSGPSEFERIGVAAKFIITNPKFGFKERDEFRYPMPFSGWEGIYTGCYTQFKDFTTFRKYINFSIVGEQVELRRNQDKLDNICTILKEIEQEIEHLIITGSHKTLPESTEVEDMEVGLL
ncbi:hypothetical protein [Colwellia psychrerythraea]|uniref:Phytanoyl-CoA dioxygenase n=1 Tax=Colwellia psychrerythraea TaxID=28229 RepID=A0A099KF57_COLPS|nr:hypothetical protein [Colwellia psychrerythraea]KGJ88243.1 hypothetical protein GAB14E_4213 [Colwellia psychrerythraea]